MANYSVEARLAILEMKVAELSEQATNDAPKKTWWREIWGTFKDNPDYEEAMRLGREYRESERPDYFDEPDGVTES